MMTTTTTPLSGARKCARLTRTQHLSLHVSDGVLPSASNWRVMQEERTTASCGKAHRQSCHAQGPDGHGLTALARRLDDCCEDSAGDEASLWLNKPERLAWQAELSSAQSMPTLAYLAACLRFTIARHTEAA